MGGGAVRLSHGRGRLVCLLACLSVLASLAGAAPATAQNTLRVIPFPGTPDASPSSEIIFSTLKKSDLDAVVVVGSTSGVHAGHLISLPDSAGVAFLPDQPFAAGETVLVRAALGSQTAAASAGNGHSLAISWSFTVAIPLPSHGGRSAGGGGASGPTQTFYSRPDLHPPLVSVSQDLDRGAGDIFLTPNHDRQPGAMILNPRGRLVWFEPRRQPVYNLEVQSYLGRPVLTWWEGRFLGGGRAVIVDQSYRTVAIVYPGEGYAGDLHEFQITPQGTALLDSYAPVQADLSSIGGSSTGTAVDAVIQEVDIRTGRVLWEWHALGHVPLSASHTRVPRHSAPFDYFHINSIQQLPNGNLLVSSRSDWAVYEISRKTGNVLWTLGGKYSSFRMDPGTNFEWQHDAHLYPDGTMTLFDDAGSPQEEPQSSAKTLFVNTNTMTVSLVHRFTHAPSLLATLAGSAQVLPDHNVMVGWGSEPVFSEYAPGGRLLMDGRFPYGVYSYRAYRFPWVGYPLTRPTLAVSAVQAGGTTFYASWNGATQVAYWRALGGATPGTLAPLGGRVPWNGFETVFVRPSRPAYMAVQALDSSGHVLRTSTVHTLPSGG